MENLILTILISAIIIFALALVIKPVCFYKIQQKVMEVFGIKVTYNEENMILGRVVGVVLLVISIFVILGQF